MRGKLQLRGKQAVSRGGCLFLTNCFNCTVRLARGSCLIFARAYFRPCFCPKHKRKHIDFSFPKFLITHSYSFLHADSSLSIDRESCVSDTHHGKVDSNFRAKRVAVVVGDEASEKIDDVLQELKFAQTLGFATLRSKTYRVRVP